MGLENNGETRASVGALTAPEVGQLLTAQLGKLERLGTPVEALAIATLGVGLQNLVREFGTQHAAAWLYNVADFLATSKSAAPN